MSDDVQDEVAGGLEDMETNVGGPMDLVDSIKDEMGAGGDQDKAVSGKVGGLRIAPSPVKTSSEVGEDGERKVPGIKIIGLSSELKKAISGEDGEDSKDTSVEDEEEEDDDEEEDEDAEEEEEEDVEDDDEDEEEDESSVETPVMAKTPKVTIKNVQKVTTPGVSNETPKKMPFAGAVAVSTGKKRGRPSRADLALREQERQEAIARGEPDPELKRKRRKPAKMMEVDSEEESKVDRKRRKAEEREERRRAKLKARSEDTEDSDEEKPKKKGRKKKILTAEEEAERDKERKRKYKEIQNAKKAKLEKRKAYLIMKRDERKAKKAEEKKREEEHRQRMAELRSQYLDDNATELPADASFLMDENSQSSNSAFTKKRKTWGDIGQTEGAGVYNPLAHVTAETLFEYKWPLEGRHSEHYFLQEQVTEFMGVKSFKRKYPDCPRRTINMEERDFLIEMKIVNETQADLGLTAIPSASVLDIMCLEFYEKYEEYMAVVNERKERSLRNYNYSSGSGTVKSEEAVKAAAEFNKKLNEERKRERQAYFDMQTFTCHYPKANKGKMKVLKKPAPGNYPVAMIPGQFVDHYKTYSSNELQLFPLNTTTMPPPTKGLTTKDLNLGSEGSESDSGSSSSDSSSDSDSDSGSDSESQQKKKSKHEKKIESPAKTEVKPKKKVDEVRPFATCKHCHGNMNQNKIGVPELMLHCTKCNQSSHPSCVGLHLELLQFVTNYDWECTDCKTCMKCCKPEDEDKMLFCDLCDRGFHIYCVGLKEIPDGRWHCDLCAFCNSCGTKCPAGEGVKDESLDWIFETKLDSKGNNMYSHTMCHPCHKLWKKGAYCPECNGVFGRADRGPIGKCWICSRQFFAKCVGIEKATDRFICSGCQKRTLEKHIAGGRKEEPRVQQTPGNSFARTPVTASYSRSGRRVTQINFANQF